MTISVAMATFNGEKYIYKQLESIVKQTILPDEIVVSDDGSIDNTLRIVTDFAKEHQNIKWTILETKENCGYIKNYFKAIQATSGELIFLSDQDDLWAENKIEIVSAFFSNTNVLSVHTNYSIIDANDVIIRDRQIDYNSGLHYYNLKAFCKRLNYCGMSSAFRCTLKPVLLSIDTDHIPTHDWTIHALAVVRDGMYVCDEVTSMRRYTGSNVALQINTTTKREGIEQRTAVVNEYIRYYSLLKEFANENESNDKCDYLDDLITVQKNRVEYLRNKSVLKWLTSCTNVKRYPSIKAYCCDLLYIMGIY